MTAWKRGGERRPIVADPEDGDPGPAGAESGEQVVPHSLEAERSLIGAVLIDNAAWPVASGEIDSADFFRDSHRRVWQAMERMSLAGSPLDLLLLKEELERSRELDEVGGAMELAAFLDGATRSTNVAYYAGIVREKARLRATIESAKKILSDAYAADRKAAEVIDDGVRTLLSLASSSAGSVATIAEATQAYLQTLDSDRGTVIPTGFVDVDSLIQGFERKHLSVVAARPSVGKSSFITVCLDNVATRGEPCALITIEMEPEQIAGNLLAVHSGVSTSKFRRKEQLTDKDMTEIVGAASVVQGRPLYLVRNAETITHVASWVRRLRDQFDIRLFAVDYLQLLGDPNARDRQREVATISRGLKQIAKNEDVAMVALAQVSRESEKRLDKRPTLSDLRESGAIEADADLVMLLYREEMHKPKEENRGRAEVIIAKNRMGPVGTVNVAFVKETTRWANLAPLWNE